MEEYRIGDYGTGIVLYRVPKGTRKEPLSSIVAYKPYRKSVCLMGNYDETKDKEAVTKFSRIAVGKEN